MQLRPPQEGFPPGFLVGGAAAVSRVIAVDQDSDKKAPLLTIEALTMYVIRRADRFGLRIKNSKAPALIHFRGPKWFAPSIKFSVTAKWTPYNPPKSITLATLIAGISYEQPVRGVAEFVLDGKTYRLEPVLEDPAAAELFFVLRDATSASSTYPACRFLYTGFPSNGMKKPGTLALDFNRLENPPCAYTTFATCPLPPPPNRLPIAITAGERRYHD
ncbi:MAG: hypothetical protein NVS9B13_11690 [Candidatus Acidiferrum sp.]